MENTDFLDSFIKKAKFSDRVLRQLKPDRYGKVPLVGGLIGASTGALMGASAHAETKALLSRQIGRAKSKKEKDRLRTAIKNQSLPKSMLVGASLMGGFGGALGAKAQRNILKSRIHDVNVMRTLKGQARSRRRAWEKAWSRFNKDWEDAFRGSRGGNPFRRAADPGTAKSFFGIGGAKTKAEVAKAYKAMAKKHHPDAGGSVEKMQEVNKHYDNIKNSDWFNKLAFIAGFEKKARGNYELI
jgi:hypothetical protein